MSIDIVDVFSIISSVFSIVLGIVAIALSIVFYKMSDKTSKDAERSANQIESSVKKLEILFEKLYSGTFDIMRDTVSDMRKYVYSDRAKPEFNDEILKEIEIKTNKAITNVVHEITSNQKTDEELEELIVNTISKAKQLEKEVVTSALRELILKYLKKNGSTEYNVLKKYLLSINMITETDAALISEIENMADEGLIYDPFSVDEVYGKSISVRAKITLK